MSVPNKMPYVIGCDIGGANLKLADCCGRCASRVFPMWLSPEQLGETLRQMLSEFPVTEETRFAVTMTGELADCFATRREGVQKILSQAEQAFAPEKTLVYAVGDRWLTTSEAEYAPWEVAASNWHALATWIGTRADQPVDLVLDIGSTTVDIIPMERGINNLSYPSTDAKTDRDRLERGQLVYTGLERTPLAAIIREVSIQGRVCPVMAERFATSDDCYVVLGLTPEFPQDCDTADNRPRTVVNAHARLARMIGEDSETLSLESSQEIAHQVIEAQAAQVASALARNLLSSATNITVVGHGRALATRALAKLGAPGFRVAGPAINELVTKGLAVTWLADQISPEAARCAPALAAAKLLAANL